jgi:hypothetical protein
MCDSFWVFNCQIPHERTPSSINVKGIQLEYLAQVTHITLTYSPS